MNNQEGTQKSCRNMHLERATICPMNHHPSQFYMNNQEGTQKSCRNMHLERATKLRFTKFAQKCTQNLKEKPGLGWSNKLLPS
jgi:hypothetical protein